LCNKKKLNIGKSKANDKAKICVSVFIISDKLFVGKNPPEDIVVKARLNESKSLILVKLKKKIIKMVDKK